MTTRQSGNVNPQSNIYEMEGTETITRRQSVNVNQLSCMYMRWRDSETKVRNSQETEIGETVTKRQSVNLILQACISESIYSMRRETNSN